MPQPTGWTETIIVDGHTLTWNEGGGIYFTPVIEGFPRYTISPFGGTGGFNNGGQVQLEIDFADNTFVIYSYGPHGELWFVEGYDSLGDYDSTASGPAPAWTSGAFNARGGAYPLPPFILTANGEAPVTLSWVSANAWWRNGVQPRFAPGYVEANYGGSIIFYHNNGWLVGVDPPQNRKEWSTQYNFVDGLWVYAPEDSSSYDESPDPWVPYVTNFPGWLDSAPDWTEARGFSEANGFKAKYGFRQRYGFQPKYGF